MSDVPRQTLRTLIAKHGRDLCSDAGRCEGLLRDYCGGYRREVNILMGALKERVPLDLLAAQSTVPRELLLARLAKRLEDQLAFTEDAARWAVESWALALGVVSDTELEERKRREAEAVPPSNATTAPGSEDEGGLKRTASANTPPPTASQTQPKPLPTQPKPQASRAQSSAVPYAPKPPASLPTPAAHSPSGSSNITRRQTSPPPTSSAQSSPAQRAKQPQDASLAPSPQPRRSRWRGCLVGCFLFILLSGLLFFVAPYVVSLLREEQRQINNEPPLAPGQ